MRHIALTVLLLAAAGVAAAQQFNVAVEVDDASRVQILVDDLTYTALRTGRNSIPCLPGTRLTVQATPGHLLTGVCEVDGTWRDDLPVASGKCYINVFGDYGSVYYVTSAVDPAGVEEIEADGAAAPVYYRLDGTPAPADPATGLYIRYDGVKIVIKQK